MYGVCSSGTWGFLGNLGGWGWVGLTLTLVFWVALIAGLTLLVVLAIRRARVPATTVPHANGQPTAVRLQTAKEILQAQYARGEITREQYEHRKQNIG
jgi:uncharacterized membrane protein